MQFKGVTQPLYLQALLKTVLVNFFLFILHSAAMSQVLQTVAYVDLAKYAGKWYEIASFPQRFQKGCTCTTAEYTLTDKNYLLVKNKCNRGSITGKPLSIRGKAFVVDNSGNSKLKIQFFWPLKGNYWILELADDYSYAVVGNPNKKSLWILSRTPQMDDKLFVAIVARAQEKGFDMSQIRLTRQR